MSGVYTGTHAYALSYEKAKKLVAINTHIQYGFDARMMQGNLFLNY